MMGFACVNCGKWGEWSTAGLCMQCITLGIYQIPGPYAPIESVEACPSFSCPSCARFAAKMNDREGMELVIRHKLFEDGVRTEDVADAVIRWMEG